MPGFWNILFGVKDPDLRNNKSGGSYKKGDFIGNKYKIYGVLGSGGFGVVYHVYWYQAGSAFALKTFQDKFMDDARIQERFRREARVWVDLGAHQNIVCAHFVDDISGRIYIAIEHIAPNEQGLNSLGGYLKHCPPDFAQSLEWAIQFCRGMEHAYSRGLRCHRDIKPDNILIGQDNTLKISDFGLAGAIGESQAISEGKVNIREGKVGLSAQAMEGRGFGTPTHMPPEQFYNATECDERSDIYSFGVVLFQMVRGGDVPFLASLPKNNSKEEIGRFWKQMHELHSLSPVPQIRSPFFLIIQRCLEKKPDKRYQTFKELREDLEPLMERELGKPQSMDTKIEEDEFDQWKYLMLKGHSLCALGDFSGAFHIYDNALEIDPDSSVAWTAKGTTLDSMGRYNDAICCYDKASKIDPDYYDAYVKKGNAFYAMRSFGEAIKCYDRALNIAPGNIEAWHNKGACLGGLARLDEAINCYNKVISNSNSNQFIVVWFNKALAEEALGRTQDAIRSYKQFIALAPAQYAEQIEYARQRLLGLRG